MAGDWIKIEHATPDKPEVYAMAEMLGIDPDHVVGALLRIWIWADQQLRDCNARGVTKTALDRNAHVTGFGDALIAVGWVEEVDGGLIFVNFDRHNGKTAKTRALNNRRVSEHRKKETQKKRHGNAAGVTEIVTKSVTREEKRREDLKPSPPNAREAEPPPAQESTLCHGQYIECPESFTPPDWVPARLQARGIPVTLATDQAVIGQFEAHYRSKGETNTFGQWAEKFVAWCIRQHSYNQTNEQREKDRAGGRQHGNNGQRRKNSAEILAEECAGAFEPGEPEPSDETGTVVEAEFTREAG